ncbi:conserved hypothetical protein [Carnobacterium sp. 17-4]|uniref:YhfX family PLP-dependent enzyme n=1 Tax=Carnobacterium sp. (strain 17-4) TaxID=208596 RepID=UPI0002058DDA|nr:YhfX family PLP-dependent enzyme [Carnobacterium sp. 17-4]AEB30188.1 conserved hypothetical protein [Carnobacterium sp. 17-4]
MFMDVVKKRNPKLIQEAITLHQSEKILPDTYVLDLDIIRENAKKLIETAKKNDIELFFMLKQIGRNPTIAKMLVELGIKNAVVVDFREAKIMMENNIPLGNVGHLVQIPQMLLKDIMMYGSKYLTVYSLEKLQAINGLAKEIGIKQKILLRVVSDEDELYPGQYGGFTLKELPSLISLFKELKYIEISGVTSFPCFLYNAEKEILEPTHNTETVKAAKKLLEKEGITIQELNIPSATSVYTLPFIKKIGGTQGEPGHALTGTTPMHAEKELAEKPAMVYVSEVSHNFKRKGYLFGGGFYRRGHLKNVLIDNHGKQTEAHINALSDENIDYYLEIDETEPIGATAIMAFRTQIFVTRSEVALVSGIQEGKPTIEGIYDSQGNYLRG